MTSWLLKRVLEHHLTVEIPQKATQIRYEGRLYIPKKPPSRFTVDELRRELDIREGSPYPACILIATTGNPYETWVLADRYSWLLANAESV